MLTNDELKKLPSGATPAILRRKSYFDGKQVVAELLTPRIDGRPKSNVRTNWTKYAAKTHSGFLTSKPVVYAARDTSADADPLARLKNVYDSNNLRASDAALLCDAITYGHGVEVVSFDGKQHVVTRTQPWEWKFVEDETGSLVNAVRRITVDPWSVFEGALVEKAREVVVVYDRTSITKYARSDKGDYSVIGEQAHPYGEVPVVAYHATDDGQSFFSDAFLTQCDTFDVTRSALQDDIRHNVDSLLAIKNVNMQALLEKDKEGVSVLQKLKDIGVFPIPKDGEAAYLQRIVDIQKFSTDLKITRASIHMMAALADLDEAIGGSEGTITTISGVALKLLFQAMIQQASEFGKQFERGLRRRVSLINTVDVIRGLSPLVDYDLTYQPNLPLNDTELLQYLPNLQGVLGTEQIIRLLPFVTDAARAFRELQDERAKTAPPTPDAQ